MPTKKKQHFLPVAYLGNYAFANGGNLRKRKVWRVGRSQIGFVPVESQCQKDWYYSKEEAAFCESYFEQFESVYGSIVNSIDNQSQSSCSESDLFRVFLMAVDLYIRGSRYRDKAYGDRFNSYLKRVQIFKENLLPLWISGESDELIRAYFKGNWSFRFIHFSLQSGLLTSDFPSIWLGSTKHPGKLCGVILPMTPSICFIGVRLDTYYISSETGTKNDSAVISMNQIGNCVDSVYFAKQLSGDEVNLIRSRIPKRNIHTREDGWEIEFIDYDRYVNLSFVKIA